ncbi:histidyl-tRNA synthetase [Draconibacterium orientale]|uniref:Histidine--tRNA ligase n=1 Tax=Draconibacterium orientale TaxID=1168034 RepID=X5DJL5_9BACT|nr:histidine--tRNA ligase [Draconibacterium orientale]AHW60742.1 histidyl-tRNA synthase [Draconibacterium orientale]SES72192.1 histidyl-tRNA synthetase [Draconibacterium orientale]
MAQKPSIPKGTRDFSPAEMVRRNYIFNTIKDVFRLYGFQPIETPAMENLSTLMGKYGEEGDKLLFKILNSGDFISKVPQEMLDEKNSNKLTTKLSEKGLRYDLTVPFARYVVQYRNDIAFPFKRYQIQPVWRADRPQKGRYREFYQCDVDVIGSNSLLNEVELVQIIDEVFQRLGINTTVKINNRKILAGIAEAIGEADRMVDITVAIDKLDKIDLEKVNAEMLDKGISQEAVDKLQPILKLEGTTVEKLAQIETVIGATEIGAKGIAEMRTMFAYLENVELNTTVELDLTLARGLNYYTGAIFEVKSNDVQIGSICGGGRYDDLTGIFGMPDVSGVGVSFGAERIYDVLVQLNAFPEESLETTKALFVNFGEKEEAYCLPVLAQLRKNGINAEIFPESAKMKKQMTYANRKEIAYVILAGDNEMAAQKFTLKNMETGEQQLVDTQELINILK